MSITYVDHKCINCGTTHKVRPADLKRGWGKTCSKSCAASVKAKKPNSNYKNYLKKKEQAIEEERNPSFVGSDFNNQGWLEKSGDY